jgi:CRP-like cAMP-binding protein
MSKTIEDRGRRKHLHTDRKKALVVKALAKKIGYLREEDFPGSTGLAALPRHEYHPDRIIKCKNVLCFVIGGSVQIRHHGYFVKSLAAGALFGDIALLGQTMLGCEAIAGDEGALIGVMDVDAAREWLISNSLAVVNRLGPRLAEVETAHYRANFQLADHRIAALLLQLAGGSSVVKGWSHEKIGDSLGLYRETVTIILDTMKADKLIGVDRLKIILLDKKALGELAEL